MRNAHFVLFWQALGSACVCNALIMRYHLQKGRPFANFIWGALLRGVNLEIIRVLASWRQFFGTARSKWKFDKYSQKIKLPYRATFLYLHFEHTKKIQNNHYL
jgi:hypothetical protein